MAPFEAYEVALELAVAMGPVIERVGRRDRDMAGQMRRATQGVPSSLAEGARRAGQDRIQLFRIASGSAAEIRTLLILARAWGYLRPTDLEAVQPLLDRELAMLWRLTHPRT
jgi:four helix bundle protein